MPTAPDPAPDTWDVPCVATLGCCRGCSECYGEGLGCHNRPAVDLIAAARSMVRGPDDERDD